MFGFLLYTLFVCLHLVWVGVRWFVCFVFCVWLGVWVCGFSWLGVWVIVGDFVGCGFVC